MWLHAMHQGCQQHNAFGCDHAHHCADSDAIDDTLDHLESRGADDHGPSYRAEALRLLSSDPSNCASDGHTEPEYTDFHTGDLSGVDLDEWKGVSVLIIEILRRLAYSSEDDFARRRWVRSWAYKHFAWIEIIMTGEGIKELYLTIACPSKRSGRWNTAIELYEYAQLSYLIHVEAARRLLFRMRLNFKNLDPKREQPRSRDLTSSLA